MVRVCEANVSNHTNGNKKRTRMRIFSRSMPLVFIIPIFCAFTYTAINLYQKEPINSPVHITEIRTIIDDAGAPSKQLQQLLSLFEIAHDNSLKDIVEKTQKAFLRQAGKERWEIADQTNHEKDQAIQLLNNLGLVQEVTPMQQEYEYALILGATVHPVRTRLAHLISLFKKGIQFKHIVVLGGQRPLDPNRESPEELLKPKTDFPLKNDWVLSGDLPKTETEMMRMVFDQAILPEEMQSTPIVFVDTPMQTTLNGNLRRPNTPDTVVEWLKSNPNPGACLVLSNQPYVGYQDAVVQSVLSKEFSIDTVGQKATEKKIVIFLDTIARWLYQEYQQWR